MSINDQYAKIEEAARTLAKRLCANSRHACGYRNTGCDESKSDFRLQQIRVLAATSSPRYDFNRHIAALRGKKDLNSSLK